MGFLSFLIVGLICGAIAKMIMKDSMGWVATLICGVIGAIVGGWIGEAIFHTNPMQGFFHWSTWVFGIIGSIIVLLIWALIASRGRSTHVNH